MMFNVLENNMKVSVNNATSFLWREALKYFSVAPLGKFKTDQLWENFFFFAMKMSTLKVT